MRKITLTEAWEGYLLYTKSRNLSENTLPGYTRTFHRFLDFLDEDLPVQSVTKTQIEQYLSHLAEHGLSGRTRRNHHTGLSALWTWLVKEEFVSDHIVHQVDAPKAEEEVIVPFSEQDIKLIMASLTRSRSYRRKGQAEPSNHSLPESLRNRAIILLLLDTGIRASELCTLKVEDVDLKNNRVTVFGKGAKYRMVPISAKTANVLWRYRTNRSPLRDDEPLFVGRTGIKFGTSGLRRMFERLKKRSGVQNIHPHRFRHTFAINYLRNGGDIFTLQRILGHSDLTMVKRYTAIANADVERAHRSASPVANWDIG